MITPDFVGQVYKDTNTGNIWRANSLTPGDWTLEVVAKQLVATSLTDTLEFKNNASLTKIAIYGIPDVGGGAGYVYVSNMSNLVELDLRGVTSLSGSGVIEIEICPSMLSLDASNLVSIGAGTTVSVLTSPVTFMSLSSLATMGAGSSVNMQGLQVSSIDLSSLTSCATGAVISFTNCAALVTVDISNCVFSGPAQVDFSGAALNQSSVDAVLHQCVLSPLFTGVTGVIGLSGGTSSTPSAAGLTDKATMIGRGCTVLTN